MPCVRVCAPRFWLGGCRRGAMAHCGVLWEAGRVACGGHRLRRNGQCAVPQRGVLGQARGARWSSWRRPSSRSGQCAMPQRGMLRQARGAARRSSWRRPCSWSGQCAMSQGRMLRQARGAARWSSWRRPCGWSGQCAMSQGRMLRQAGGAARWSGGGRRGLALGKRRCGYAGQQEREDDLHAASPSSGRTVTTRIIPACMCISRWQ